MDSFEIARLAGVSRKTVQRVLNNHPNVKAETREKIWRIMEQHHYLPNATARNLSSRKTRTIGVFMIQEAPRYQLYSDDLYFGPVIGAIVSRAATRGYHALLTIVDISDPSPLFDLFKQKSIDGGLMISWNNLQPIVDQLEAGRFTSGFFLQNNVDKLNDNRIVPLLDEHKAAMDATRYLLGLGHRDIGIITGDMDNVTARQRLTGFVAAMEQHHLPVPDYRIAHGDFTEQGGRSAVEAWLKSGHLPTAVVCANDQTAFGALQSLHHHGIDVPGQVSLIGFDDLLITQYTHPPLTTMRVPRVDMAVALTDRLIDRLDGVPEEKQSRHGMFQAELIERHSCAKPAHNIKKA